MDKVSFSIVGAQKSGTTALAHFIGAHPDILLTHNKEGHFFDNDQYFIEHEIDYSIYHQMFDAESEARYYGDVTPSYMYWHDAPRRMWQYNPDFKIIVLLRNPVERAYSHWNMQRERGIEKRPFIEAIKQEQETLKQTLPQQNKPFSYVDRGFYAEQLRRLFKFFPVNQVLVVKQDDLLNQHGKTLKSILEFIGLEDSEVIKPCIVHRHDYVSALDSTSRDYLMHMYEFEIRQLERMLNWN
ncbi:MAG: sulfotransferase, partial [Gammaproteobacteria bacterium]|nr:sulfotransferase [Gammaproteobacteria bacterium]